MSHHTPTDAAAPTSGPFQGVNDREIHREIDTADLFYDPASANQDFSKPPPLKSAFPPSDLHASSPPDDITRFLNAAPAGELGGAEDCETCLSCKKAKRAAESWAELDEFTCACEDQAVEGGGVSGGINYFICLFMFITSLPCQLALAVAVAFDHVSTVDHTSC